MEKGNTRSPSGVQRPNKQAPVYPNSLPGSRSSSPGRNVMMKRAMFEGNSPSRSSSSSRNRSPHISVEASTRNDTDIIKIEGVEEFESVYNSSIKRNPVSYVSSTSFPISNTSDAFEKPKSTDQIESSNITVSEDEGSNKTSEVGDQSSGKGIFPDYISAVLKQPSDVYKRKVERSVRLREDGVRSRRHQTLQGPISHAPNELHSTSTRKQQYVPTYVQPVASQSSAKANSVSEIDAFTQKRDASQSNRLNTYELTGKSQPKTQLTRLSRQRFASSGDSNSSEMSINQERLKKSKELVELQRQELEGEKSISRLAKRHLRQNAQEQNNSTNQSIEQSAKEVCGNNTVANQNYLNAQRSIGVDLQIKKQSEGKPEAAKDKVAIGRTRTRQRNRTRQKQQPRFCIAETEDKYSTLPADFKPAEVTNVLINSELKCDPSSVKNPLPSDNCTETHLPNRNELMITDEQTSVVLENSRKKVSDAKRDIANHKQSLQTNQSIDKHSPSHRGLVDRRPQTNSEFQAKRKQSENRSKLVSDLSAKFESGFTDYKAKPKEDIAARNQRVRQAAKPEPANEAYSQPMLKATIIKKDYWPRDKVTEKLLNHHHSSSNLSSTALEQLNNMSESAAYSSKKQLNLARSVLTNVNLLSSSKETNLNDPVEMPAVNNSLNASKSLYKPHLEIEPTIGEHTDNRDRTDYSGIKNDFQKNVSEPLKEWNYDDLDSKLNNFSENFSDTQSNTGNQDRSRDLVNRRFKKSDSDLNLPSLREITLRGKTLFVADEGSPSRVAAPTSNKLPDKESTKVISSEGVLMSTKQSWPSSSSSQGSNNIITNKSTSERKNSIVSESTALPKSGNSLQVRNSTESDEGCYVDEVNAVDSSIVQANIANFTKNHGKTRNDLLSSGGRRRRKGSAATGQSSSDGSNNGENPNRSLSDPTHNRKKSPNLEKEEELRAIDSNFEVALKLNNLENGDVCCNMSECSDATSIQSSSLNDSQVAINDDNLTSISKSLKTKTFPATNSKETTTAQLLKKNDSILSLSSSCSSYSDSNLPETMESQRNSQCGKRVEEAVDSYGSISSGSSMSDVGDRSQPINKPSQFEDLDRELEDLRKKASDRRESSKIESSYAFDVLEKDDDPVSENPLEKEEGEFQEILESMNKCVKLSHELSSNEFEIGDSLENAMARKVSVRGRRAGIVMAPSLNDVLGNESAKTDETQLENKLHRSTSSLHHPTATQLENTNKRIKGLALRKHVVTNLLETEYSYVDSLDTLIKCYQEPLKRPESAQICEPHLVDEIFFQIPQMFLHHNKFYAAVRDCHSNWDPDCKIGELFLNSFNDATLVQSYTSFTNNYLNARLAISAACEANRSFKSFLEQCQRENKTKQSIDDLLIKPIQRMPRYELLIKDLLKHTPENHPDHEGLLAAQKKMHSLVLQMNEEKSALEAADKATKLLHEIEHSIDGCAEISGTFDRRFIQQFFCFEVTSQKPGNRRERSLWLFSDLLLCTTLKKTKNTAARRNSLIALSDSPLFEINCKYKYLWKYNLEGIELRGDNYLQLSNEHQLKQLEKDQKYLKQIEDLISKLHSPHSELDAAIGRSREQNSQAITDNQLQQQQMQQFSSNSPGRLDIVFPSHRDGLKVMQFEFSENSKSNFEKLFWNTKNKLNTDKKATSDSLVTSINETESDFLKSIPISKTRNGMQFSCAAPCIDSSVGSKEVWVCNTDGYVGQVCFLSLGADPQQTQCLTVCHAKILCIAWVPSWDRKLVPTRLLLEEISKTSLGGKSRRRPSSANLATSIIAFDEDTESDEDNTSPYSTTAVASPFNTFNSNSPYNTGQADEEITLPIMSPLSSALMCQKKYAHNCRSHSYSCLPLHGRELTVKSKSASRDFPENDTPTTDPASYARASQNSMISGANVEGGGAYKKDSDGVTRYGSLGDLLNDGNGDVITGSQTLGNNPSMWLGTEDGKINIYLTEDEFHRGNYHCQLRHSSSVQCILSHQDQVFVALGNGELIIYCRNHANGGQWNFTQKKSVEGTTSTNPITKMLIVNENELWCGCQNEVRIYDISSLESKGSFLVSSDNKRQIYCMSSFGCGVWIAMDKKSQIELFNSKTHESISKVDVSRAVNKMLMNCDAIIRQHKAACLRITSLLVCKNLLWIGTSAGVVLNLKLPPISDTTSHFPIGLEPQGLSYGHTGHVRFLTAVDIADKESPARTGRRTSTIRRPSSGSLQSRGTTLVISGGDGYEDFQKNSISDAGREDSTNHLLIWKV